MLYQLHRPADPLQAGDRVAVVAPGYRVSPEEAEAIGEALRALRFDPWIAPQVFTENGALAGPEEHRAAALAEALADQAARAIWCARGGYGSARALRHLDRGAARHTRKPVIGYSDASLLHAALLHPTQVAPVHGANALDLTRDDRRDGALAVVELLRGGDRAAPLKELLAGATVLRPGRLMGEIAGGNLSLVQTTLGTPFELRTEGRVLFLEDVDEYLYRVDRMLVHLRDSGRFARLGGLVLGRMTDCGESPRPYGKTLAEIVLEVLEGTDFPILINAGFGHGAVNLPFVLGDRFAVDTDDLVS